jgi:hypothetical protein
MRVESGCAAQAGKARRAVFTAESMSLIRPRHNSLPVAGSWLTIMSCDPRGPAAAPSAAGGSVGVIAFIGAIRPFLLTGDRVERSYDPAPTDDV